MSVIRKIAKLALVALICSFSSQAFANDFSESEKQQIQNVVEELKLAMGSVTINPEANCPGLTEALRIKLTELDLLSSAASQLPTEILENSYHAKALLDTELAFKFVEKNCA